jgi:hypothetical protein
MYNDHGNVYPSAEGGYVESERTHFARDLPTVIFI